MDNSIIMRTDEGEELTFYIEEETRVNGISYILVSDSKGDEANAYILKDISGEGEEDARYVFVEDETESDAVAELFSRMIDDIDLIR